MNLVNEGVLPPDELDDRDERREEQESARSRETVADIVAEIRAYGAQPPPRCMWLDIADRVETAARRERDHAIEHATRHAEAVARDNCRDCVHNPRGKNFEGGNAAAVREALLNIQEYAAAMDVDDGNVLAILDACRDALSLPPRNCDKMPDIDNLTMHDLAKSPCKSTLECASREELLALVRWLLAPAAERKGEGDGSK